MNFHEDTTNDTCNKADINTAKDDMDDNFRTEPIKEPILNLADQANPARAM